MKRLHPDTVARGSLRFAERLTLAGLPNLFSSPRRFLREVRGGATAIVAASVTVMTVGGAALISDHLWLIDQRDVLDTAAAAASVAATLEIDRQLTADPDIGDTDLNTALKAVAKRYVVLNLAHLPPDRLKNAKDTLGISLTVDRPERTVGVEAAADLGGTLFSGRMPLLGDYKGPEKTYASAKVDADSRPTEVILAIDVSGSMHSRLDGTPKKSRIDGTSKKSRMEIVKEAATQLVDILEPDEKKRLAIGVVPWHHHVRLDDATARRWSSKGWARYPTRRRYEVPYENCDYDSPDTCTNLPPAVEEALPASAPETWEGCLTEDRFEAGLAASLPAAGDLLDLPARKAFAQSFFRSGWGLSYRCLDQTSTSWPDDLMYQRCYKPPPHNRLAEDADQWPLQGLIQDAQSRCGTTPSLLPLSTDPAEIGKGIDDLAAVAPSETYSALGVLWGHRLLLPSWKDVLGDIGDVHPLDTDAPDGDKVRRAIVLLTDGEDTQCGNGNPGCDNSALGIARTDACSAAKQAGIEIFVIAAMKPDLVSDDLKDGLRACSSEPDNPDGTYVFLDNATPEALRSAFADIAKQLRTVRRIY